LLCLKCFGKMDLVNFSFCEEGYYCHEGKWLT
jgi:hypothetical protein